jgi:2-polyprenyl-3-methyl-5-hydroxy-6-metoxy-1,4-benzoquinol methylase
MAGGFEAALTRGAAEIESLCASPANGLVAVDLGSGFGMHAIPLARHGYTVIAVDSSATLLQVLRERAGALSIHTAQSDLLDFQQHLQGKAHLMLCMGDTLTHLPNEQAVEQLFIRVANSLHRDGQFITTFRDYTQALLGANRFIQVRSDSDRVLSCFLEYAEHHVTVHDLLHERHDLTWQLRVSAYQKLRLSPAWVSDVLRSTGFKVGLETGRSGMVRIVATI